MRAYDVIQELYRGNLRPCDRSIRSDTDFAITTDAFASQERWLRENLDGEAAKRFDELVSSHNGIVDTMSYENFRTGFQFCLSFEQKNLHGDHDICRGPQKF